jgi:glycosyltransferase involved in cell wall biosynthesis
MARPEIVSIVTIVLNDPSGFSKTARSIAGQNYKDVEWIVVDGGSADGTVAEIKKHERHIRHWISEHDNGLYDAMNKGLARASGDWVLFLNAGDVLADSSVLSRVFSQDVSKYDVIVGDWIADYLSFKVARHAGSAENLWQGMIFSHQSLLIRTFLVKPSGFRVKYHIGADYEMVTRLFFSGRQFHYFPEPISVTEAYGISHRKMYSAAREHRLIFDSFRKMTLKEKQFHFKKAVLLWAATFLYRVLPNQLYLLIVKKISDRNHTTLK